MAYILGIESSCDETAASVSLDGREILSDVVYSQAEIHKKYGGVVPEIASRNHILSVTQVIEEAVGQAGIRKEELDAVAVTVRPGLIGALLVGLSAAKGYAYALGKPLVPVNHLHGHIAANYIADKSLEPPFICLVASGGHSHVVEVTDYNRFTVLGATMDDAAGEAFDKVARVLGLGYPGGPAVSRCAERGKSVIPFPRPIHGLDFSFSGVKTAVINYVHKAEQKGETVSREDVAASFQTAIVDVLTTVTMEAAKERGMKKIALAGGVAANSCLRASLEKAANSAGMQMYMPPLSLCTDNGAMISCAGYYAFRAGERAELSQNAFASLEQN
ncbi:MAG: tRNA (adenosine(37)-N6)-threonylcarbamoyltransferase complex transferase subunit TsaD [Ruminococcaceae bacterium]|nr:tRNA (adenosine(37)-N6)-threonylcarbamoyltransferase complex transferase subunit TsaD [Oscillospiraceae bacterium]